MYNPIYLKAILIYVKDKETGYIHIVGTDQHDRLYLDDNEIIGDILAKCEVIEDRKEVIKND